MNDKEAYDLARRGDARCIPHLLMLITFAAFEILRLEHRVADLQKRGYNKPMTKTAMIRALYMVFSTKAKRKSEQYAKTGAE